MLNKLINSIYIYKLKKSGFRFGKNFNIEKGANIDRAFCNIISCGDNVTLAKDVYILAHDASMKKFIGKTKVGPVKIGSNVFIGARTVVLPGVKIGDNVIIGANSVVTKNIPSGELWAGCPARFIKKTSEYINSKKEELINNKDKNINYVD